MYKYSIVNLQINYGNLFKQVDFMLNHSEMTYANVLSDTWSSLRQRIGRTARKAVVAATWRPGYGFDRAR